MFSKICNKVWWRTFGVALVYSHFPDAFPMASLWFPYVFLSFSSFPKSVTRCGETHLVLLWCTCVFLMLSLCFLYCFPVGSLCIPFFFVFFKIGNKFWGRTFGVALVIGNKVWRRTFCVALMNLRVPYAFPMDSSCFPCVFLCFSCLPKSVTRFGGENFVLLWCIYGVRMLSLWLPHGFLMVSLCFPLCAVFAKSVTRCEETHLLLLWCTYMFLMHYLCFPYGFPMASLWRPYVFLSFSCFSKFVTRSEGEHFVLLW